MKRGETKNRGLTSWDAAAHIHGGHLGAAPGGSGSGRDLALLASALASTCYSLSVSTRKCSRVGNGCQEDAALKDIPATLLSTMMPTPEPSPPVPSWILGPFVRAASAYLRARSKPARSRLPSSSSRGRGAIAFAFPSPWRPAICCACADSDQSLELKVKDTRGGELTCSVRTGSAAAAFSTVLATGAGAGTGEAAAAATLPPATVPAAAALFAPAAAPLAAPAPAAAPAAALTAAPSSAVMRFETSCLPPKLISPSPVALLARWL